MSWNRYGPIVLCLVLVASTCGAEDHPKSDPALRIFTDLPVQIDPNSRYLFYLHGAIIEHAGVRPTHPKFGVYEYREILEIFAGRGFVVISEARPAGTNGAVYAEKVADQVGALMKGGVSPEHITVVGFSKGGGIAITASSILSEERLNFVFMGACGPWLDSRPEIVPHGRLLALREKSDDLVGSCEELFARTTSEGERKEIILELGGGHGAFYRPQSEWLGPVVEWAN
ncbi:MAG: alpha/beta hydrolase [Acidobacteria bacterium]|uniref:Alpha/beta hydrolase n=1 Tax=Candidatus Sulfomarinibacter kjeldsenii TaxID=2885994 RepID=A0A8J7C431_9BACT|nr:alpha/beta hydrolase [Candidatus Sulfomarinibacter kjeldsenii]